ncbi:MAG: chemotaxis protein CheA [Kangiellaceae bacterium]|nr:chemotaxis protein CheA [Kangiellaceae bacterium]
MSFEADEEILQDFLIEAGEILEEMSEQLVALENDPQNMDLLNGIFRGFHTVKGGAGFLNLTPLVDICHITENIFDILRNGDRVADADLMDNILQSLDLVNEMFDSVRRGEEPEEASQEFLAHLGTYAKPIGEDTEVEAIPAHSETNDLIEPADEQGAENEEITDDEFDTLLDELHSVNSDATVNDATKALVDDKVIASGDISDSEFEALLDELHGDGQFDSAKVNESDNATKASAAMGEPPAQVPAGDEITDDEFEALLDELHGKDGKIESKEPDIVDSTLKQKSSVEVTNKASNEAIDDSEFEALLDELHGSGKGPSVDGSEAKPAKESKPHVSKPEAIKPKAASTPKVTASSKENKVPKQKNKPVSTKTAKPVAAKSAPEKKTSASAKKPTAVVTEATVRVDTKRLDDIMNMVGELVLARNRLKTVSASLDSNEDLSKAVANLDIVTGDLQGAVMKTRMQPIKKVFGRFPRVVRDLARSLKKEISLNMIGEDTDLDKNLVEALADPLVHLVRNSVDHGIEMPDVRVEAGKSRSGTITLSAAQEGDHIMLIIKDDGKGMDADILRGIAVEKGLMDKEQADRLTDNECYNLIFHAGFSTKKEISDISGRGVGMDVVKTKITQLNGSLDIESELGTGTKILIKVPLTLAILPTLMVKLKDQAFAFPLTAVNEIFHLDLTKTNTVDGQLMIVVREKALPLFFLNDMLSGSPPGTMRDKEGHVVLAQIGTQTVGFVVDSLVGQEEVVIKPLGKSLQGTPGMAGATITSDGKIALILDIPSLLKHYVS